MEEDATFGECAEKRVCTSSDTVPEYQDSSEGMFVTRSFTYTL
jgi:hypothetical protein